MDCMSVCCQGIYTVEKNKGWMWLVRCDIDVLNLKKGDIYGKVWHACLLIKEM